MLGIIWAICTIAVWVIYHKIFNVIYFDLANGCLKEVIICILFGALLTGLVVAFWYISIPIAILFVVILFKKRH